MSEELLEIEETLDELISCDTDEALKYCFHEFREKNKLEFLIYIAKVYLVTGYYDEAISYVNMAFQLGCNYFTYGNIIKGKALYKKNLYDESKKCFLKVLEEEPENYEATVLIIKINVICCKYDEAINRAVDYIEEYDFDNEKVAELLAIIGIIYLENLNNDELSKEAFDQALKSDKNCLKAKKGMAYYYYYKKEYEKAIEYFNNAMTHNNEDETIYYGLALCYKELNIYDEMEKNLLKANILNPCNVDVLIEYAYEMIRQERNDDAIEIFEQVLEFIPNNVDIRNLVNELKE